MQNSSIQFIRQMIPSICTSRYEKPLIREGEILGLVCVSCLCVKYGLEITFSNVLFRVV